jgi:hypothetical protein
MPVIRDREGNIFSIPSTELQRFKVTEEELSAISLQDDDEVQLQGVGSSPSPNPYQWYAGD